MVWYSIKLSIIMLFSFRVLWALWKWYSVLVRCSHEQLSPCSSFEQCSGLPACCERTNERTALLLCIVSRGAIPSVRHLYSWHYIKKFSANPQILLLDIYLNCCCCCCCCCVFCFLILHSDCVFDSPDFFFFFFFFFIDRKIRVKQANKQINRKRIATQE